ncbi:hypothetical protein Taro_042877 [Colocasia esculenta]|uniref:Gnk2-homologous domain-containing protein n=1 Tax=Colocasia esculenta TaxID=4460 RepID=A0A843WXM1_COLES|nr:hypothetical protein [Colocasia esculenta]
MAFPVLHSAPLLLLRLSSLFLLLASQYCSGYLFYQSCVSGNYTNESPFHENLLSLLSSLSSRAPANDGYFNDTIGQAPDLVYGLALCRGDVVEAPCRECLANAANQVATVLCPNKKNATVWYETCLLRYSDRSFFGIDEGGKYTDSSYPNVTGAANYGAVLGGLLRGLRERAVRSPRLFAAGKENVTSFREIYGLVQCTRDITPDVCHSCLTYMFQYTNTCCANLQEARQMGASCFLRFQANRFYNASGDAADSPPLPPVSLPATTPGATDPLGRRYAFLFPALPLTSDGSSPRHEIKASSFSAVCGKLRRKFLRWLSEIFSSFLGFSEQSQGEDPTGWRYHRLGPPGGVDHRWGPGGPHQSDRLEAELPSKLQFFALKSYAGLDDLVEHFDSFDALMTLQGASDAIKCRTFTTTLVQSA